MARSDCSISSFSFFSVGEIHISGVLQLCRPELLVSLHGHAWRSYNWEQSVRLLHGLQVLTITFWALKPGTFIYIFSCKIWWNASSIIFWKDFTGCQTEPPTEPVKSTNSQLSSRLLKIFKVPQHHMSIGLWMMNALYFAAQETCIQHFEWREVPVMNSKYFTFQPPSKTSLFWITGTNLILFVKYCPDVNQYFTLSEVQAWCNLLKV
jgi:hypothetical protein